MGFFRRLFGPKKPKKKTTKIDPSSTSASKEWELDAGKRAIAMATATAAVAEAALAAAHAAAEVVRLTNGGVGTSTGNNVNLPLNIRRRRHLAAVNIQSAFRRYLARRALRALKALVKLQALVRGHIVRKQMADMLRRMQTLVRLQDCARVTRSRIESESVHSTRKSSLSYNPLPESPDKIGYHRRVYSNKFDGPSSLKRSGSNSKVRNSTSLDRRRLASSGWLDRWMEEGSWNNSRDASSLRYVHADNEKVDKILEVDTWKPHSGSPRNARPFQTTQHIIASDNNSPLSNATKEPSLIPIQSSVDYYSSNTLKYPIRKEEVAASGTAENSPQTFSRPGSKSARRAEFSPTRSEYSWGYFSSYAGFPSYMANTESSRAKVRSQSVPRQRLELEKYSLTKSIQEFCEAGTISETGLAQDDDFLNTKAFRSSSHSNRIQR